MRRLNSAIPGILVAAFWVLMSPAFGLAQQGSEPPQRPRRERPDLDLSQEQKAQVKQIREEAREKMQALRNDSSLSPEERQARMQALRKETHEKMDAVLTPEQREKLKQFREEKRERRGGGPGGGRGRHGQRPPQEDHDGPGGR